MSSPQMVDAMSHYKQPGITVGTVPIPAGADCEAWLDHAQWVKEKIALRLERVTKYDRREPECDT